MNRTNVLAPDNQLPVDISARDAGKVLEYSPEYWLPRIAALLGAIAGVSQATLTQVPVTFTLDTSIYASGDLLADTQPIAGALRVAGLASKLTSFTLLDKDNNTAAQIDVVFLRSNTSMGTENAAPTISDANAGTEIIGVVQVLAGDFVAIGTGKQATKILPKAMDLYAAAGTSVYVALITRGTPTQTASGITGNFLMRQE